MRRSAAARFVTNMLSISVISALPAGRLLSLSASTDMFPNIVSRPTSHTATRLCPTRRFEFEDKPSEYGKHLLTRGISLQYVNLLKWTMSRLGVKSMNELALNWVRSNDSMSMVFRFASVRKR